MISFSLSFLNMAKFPGRSIYMYSVQQYSDYLQRPGSMYRKLHTLSVRLLSASLSFRKGPSSMLFHWAC